MEAAVTRPAARTTPIGVVRGSTEESYRALTANVLSAGKPSDYSTRVTIAPGEASV